MDRYRLGALASERSSGSGSFNGSSHMASDPTLAFVRADSGRVVSLRTCSKMCAISFTVGVFVGFTLKRRLRLWVAKMLKRMKDD